MHHEPPHDDESSDGIPFQRRTFLKAVGATAGVGVSGFSGVAAAAKAPSLGTTRRELSAEATARTLESALASPAMTAVLSAVPGGDTRLQTASATAYSITVQSTHPDYVADGPTSYTQVIVPVRGAESDLAFATDGVRASAGVELTPGRFVTASLEADGDVTVLHRTRPDDATRARHVAAVRASADYDAAVARLPAATSVDHDDASVTVTEELGRAVVVFPFETAGGTDGLVVAELDVATDDVVTIQSSYWDCVANCLALSSPAFYGACAPICSPCAVIPSLYTCAPCAACIGIALTLCGGRCAI